WEGDQRARERRPGGVIGVRVEFHPSNAAGGQFNAGVELPPCCVGRMKFDSDPNYLLAATRVPLTRHTVFPTSSATSNAPCASIATPTGRPDASPFAFTKPVSTSIGAPDGMPSL